VTWDFENDIEIAQHQVLINGDNQDCYHVVKGMNMKMNYYIDNNQLIDLEYCIPVRQVNMNQMLDHSCISYSKQIRNINQIYNQRKIFHDNQRFLGVETASCLYYPLSHMDILYW